MGVNIDAERRRIAVPCDHRSDDHLAPFRIHDADNADLGDVRMPFEHRFDFFGMNALAA